MALFDSVRLPEDVERGAKGGPRFKTTVVPLVSGREQRNIDWSLARAAWDIGYGMDNKAYYSTVQDFYYARRGKGRGFRFKDWSDFECIDELIGIGDGANLLFQSLKTYGADDDAPYIRVLTRLVAGTLVVRVDGVVKTLTTHYTVAVETGIITFTGGNAPANLKEVRIDVEFDVPVRFDTDEFDLTLELADAGEVLSLPIVEIRE